MTSFAFSQAKLQVKNAKVNFGFAKRGDVIRNNYDVCNTGTTPLVITEAEVSCSCTSVEFSRQPLLPGQSMTLTVIFNTASVYGRQDRSVYLKSNDPRGDQQLRYKGVVSKK